MANDFISSDDFPESTDDHFEEPILMYLKGSDGSITLYEDRIVLSQKGLMSQLVKGLLGEKVIFLSAITGIQVKKPGFAAGYIQFMHIGGHEPKGGILSAVKDENSIKLMWKKQYETAVELKNRILELKDRQPSLPVTGIAPVFSTDYSAAVTADFLPASVADELAKFAHLLVQGVITQEEFEAQKRRLLSS